MSCKKCASQRACGTLAAVLNTLKHSGHPVWRHPRQMQPLGLPADVKPWLLDESSLTERLVRASGGDFRVERLSQRWRRPHLSESKLLGLPQGQWALVREVALRCHGQAWVYARSVIPAATLTGRLRRLRRLQNQSLGALLFQHPQLRRDAFEIARLPANSRYVHPGLRQDTPAWARRSCFTLYGHSILVSEVFLERFEA